MYTKKIINNPIGNIMKKIISLLLFTFSLTSLAETKPLPNSPEAKVLDAAKAHVVLGSSYYEEGKYQVSKEEANLALSIKPNFAPALNLLGLSYFAEKNSLKAKEFYLKSLNIDPNNGDTNNNYAILLCEDGSYKESVDYFGKAMLDPNYLNTELSLVNAGICLFRNKDFSAATKFFDGSLKLNPTNVVSIFYMAKILESEKKYQEAYNNLERVHSATAATAESNFLGAVLCLKLNKKEEFAIYKEKLIRDFPDSKESATIKALVI